MKSKAIFYDLRVITEKYLGIQRTADFFQHFAGPFQYVRRGRRGPVCGLSCSGQRGFLHHYGVVVHGTAHRHGQRRQRHYCRCEGARDYDRLSRSVHSALIVTTLYGLLVMALGLAIAEPLLVLLKTKDELLDGAVLYMRVYLLGTPGPGHL